MHCIVLYCMVLYCIVLYCIGVYCIVLYSLLAVLANIVDFEEKKMVKIVLTQARLKQPFRKNVPVSKCSALSVQCCALLYFSRHKLFLAVNKQTK